MCWDKSMVFFLCRYFFFLLKYVWNKSIYLCMCVIYLFFLMKNARFFFFLIRKNHTKLRILSQSGSCGEFHIKRPLVWRSPGHPRHWRKRRIPLTDAGAQPGDSCLASRPSAGENVPFYGRASIEVALFRTSGSTSVFGWELRGREAMSSVRNVGCLLLFVFIVYPIAIVLFLFYYYFFLYLVFFFIPEVD